MLLTYSTRQQWRIHRPPAGIHAEQGPARCHLPRHRAHGPARPACSGGPADACIRTKWSYRLQGLESLVTGIDKSHFRPLQKESFLCQARCCDSSANQAALQAWCGARPYFAYIGPSNKCLVFLEWSTGMQCTP